MTHASATDPTAPARLLLIDCAGALAGRLAAPLMAGFAVEPVVVGLTSGRQAVDLLRTSSFDVVAAELAALCDIAERHDDRIGRLARAATGAIVIVLAEDASISAALGAMRAGAHDCVASSIDSLALVERFGDLGRRHGKARPLARRASGTEALVRAAEPPAAAPSIPMMHDLVLPMWRQEQRIIEDAIQRFAGNVALAAAALELSPSTIYRKRQAWAEVEDKRGAA